MLEQLREKNPEITIHSVEDPQFTEYGKVYPLIPVEELFSTTQTMFEISEGTMYEASNDRLKQIPAVGIIGREIFGEFRVQVGCCYGYNTLLNGMEYHSSSEVMGAVTDMVLMLGQLQDVDDTLGWNSDLTEYFYVPKGTLLEIYATTLHLAPCRVDENQFKALILLPEGTNTPLAQGPKDKLWMKNKWMLAHSEGPAAKRGAYVGVYGENPQIKTL